MIIIIKKIINKANHNSIGAAALIVSFFGVLSRILGLVRDRILAAHYGAGDTLDVYYAAFRLPDLLFELLVVGALGAALIPVFSSIITSSKDMQRAWRCANGVLIILVITFGFLAVLGIIFAPYLVHFIVPGFPEEKMMQTVDLSRIMFLSPIIFSASAVLGNVLVSLKKFVVYSGASLFYNIGIIIGVIFLTSIFGDIGLAMGVILGAFLHFLIYFIAIRSLGLKLTSSLSILKNNYDVLNVFKLMLPRMFTSASNQIPLLLMTIFSSTLAAGSIASFSLASNIQASILGLVGIPFSLAAFPALTEAYSEMKYSHFSLIISKTFRRILYYTVPLSVILFILREQAVRVFFGAGHFDLDDTILTYNVLGILCLSLFAQSIIPLLARGFYAMHDTRTPLYAALTSQLFNVAIIFFFIRDYELSAIAIAFSVTAILNATMLFVLLSQKNRELKYFKIGDTLGKILLASGFSAVTTHYSRNFIGSLFYLDRVWHVLLQLVIPAGIGLFFYILITALFKMDEFETIRKKIIIRIFGRPQVATEEQNTTL
ncbi:MAG: murein biosynthesis integral membrane protein MurJ [Candidatus Moranbacteria bacterium]|nr:murein biosynthesis integral membrane protein MurJ [Candidatus Moranbacteria bacterium]